MRMRSSDKSSAVSKTLRRSIFATLHGQKLINARKHRFHTGFKVSPLFLLGISIRVYHLKRNSE